jgi:hypothetical protein
MRSTRSDRLKSAGEIALDRLRTTLQVAKDVSSSTGVPGLAGGISGLAAILDAVQVSCQHRMKPEKSTDWFVASSKRLTT